MSLFIRENVRFDTRKPPLSCVKKVSHGLFVEVPLSPVGNWWSIVYLRLPLSKLGWVKLPSSRKEDVPYIFPSETNFVQLPKTKGKDGEKFGETMSVYTGADTHDLLLEGVKWGSSFRVLQDHDGYIVTQTTLTYLFDSIKSILSMNY